MPDTEFTITVEGQDMRVSYSPNWSRFANYAHLEFHSPHEPRRRIPVSDTGYRSHFSPKAEIESFPSIEEYAHALALALIEEKRKSSSEDDDEATGQGSLF